MKLARRSLFQGVCGALLGRVLPEPVAERVAARVTARANAIAEGPYVHDSLKRWLLPAAVMWGYVRVKGGS